MQATIGESTLSQQYCFSLKQNALFLHTATSRTLCEVANALHLSAAAVTRGLAEMERSLGAVLISRARQSNKLTDAGQAFLPHAKRIYECQLSIVKAIVAPQKDSAALTRIANRLTIQQIAAFVAVNDLGSFGKAAREMQMTQGNLSRLLKELETLLGVELLHRFSAGSSITPSGRAALLLAKELLYLNKQADCCMRHSQSIDQKKISLVGSQAVMPLVMPQLIKELKTDFARHQVECINLLSDQVESAVQSGSALLGLCASSQEKSWFDYLHLLQAPLGLLWSPKLPMPSVIQSLEDLAQIPFLKLRDNTVITESLAASQTPFPAYFKSAVSIGSVDAGIDLVRCGEFAMLITGVGAGREYARDLKFLPLPHLLPSIKVSIIKSRNSLFDIQRELACSALANSVLKTKWDDSIQLLRKPLGVCA